VPDTPSRAEPSGVHSAVLLGVPGPRRDGAPKYFAPAGGVDAADSRAATAGTADPSAAGSGDDDRATGRNAAPGPRRAAPTVPPQRLRRAAPPDPVVNDAAWERIAPLLPERPRRRRNPGRKPLDDRAALNGILVVLSRRIGFEKLPQELEYGSGMTCWRRLRDWQQAGVWPQIARVLREEMPETRRIDFDRVVDSGKTADGGEAGAGKVARRPRSAAMVRQPSPVAMEFGFTALRRGR
jgi:transposase